MGISSVTRWAKHFKDTNTDITDQSCHGQPLSNTPDCNEQKADMLNKEN